MKIRVIKDDEVVISKNEYDYLKGLNVRYGKLLEGVDAGTAAFIRYMPLVAVNCAEYIVEMNCGNVFFPIKRFTSDDPEYNKVRAEELVELLNQKQ